MLVSCADGKVFEVEAPVPSFCDTTTSYHLRLLRIRVFVFESIKSRLRVSQTIIELVTHCSVLRQDVFNFSVP